MGKIRFLQHQEINNIFANGIMLYFIIYNDKIYKSSDCDAICSNSVDYINSYIKAITNNNETEIKKFKNIALNVTNTKSLLSFFNKFKLTQILLLNTGVLQIDNIRRAVAEQLIIDALKYKLDNEYISWIGFDDGTIYKHQEEVCLFLDETEAEQVAKKINGHLAKYTISTFVFSKIIDSAQNYYVLNQTVPGSVIITALQQHFFETELNFQETKMYIDEGLMVYAGTNDDDEFDIFLNNGQSAFFTEKADESLINPLIQQTFPSNPRFYKINKRESLYPFAHTPYVFIDNKYHVRLQTFDNAIMGRNDYRNWTLSEKQETTQRLFKTQYLYIILSQKDYRAKERCSYPLVINSQLKKIWIFDDYGKALNFCQQKNIISDEGYPFIGLLCSQVPGLDLLSTISLAKWDKVEQVELNPLEDDRMLLGIDEMFGYIQGYATPKEQIPKHYSKDNFYSNEDAPPYNDIMLT